MNICASPFRNLSPARGLLLRAALLAVFFGLCEAAGLRDYTAFLSGTQPGAHLPAVTAVLGVIYLVAYFGATLLSPILLLAAGFLGLGRFLRHRFRMQRSRP
ncbi:MAG: hypothetical protein NTV49_01685 [Kiritimatiellaeota bacterium]|nr:hypothetical protein [Kiritimatiellota bacterium]